MRSSRLAAMTDHAFYIEVTVAVCIAADGKPLGDNIVDTTLAFSAHIASPPGPVADEQINKTLAHNISPIIAAIRATLLQLGFASSIEAVEERLVDHAREVGSRMSEPVSVIIVPESAKPRTGLS